MEWRVQSVLTRREVDQQLELVNDLQLLVLKLGGQRQRSLDQTPPRDTGGWNRCIL